MLTANFAILMENKERTDVTDLDLFEELGNVLEYLRVGDDIANLQLKSIAARQMVSHCTSGRSLAEAFFLVCEEHGARLGSLLFGSIRPTYDNRAQELTAKDQGQSLQVILCMSKEPLQASSVYAADTVILYTDFKSFTLWRTDKAGQVSRPFGKFNTREICEEIAFAGSVWAIVYPTHYAIVSRTVSYAFSQNTGGALFSTKQSTTDNLLAEERDAHSRLSCIGQYPITQLLSLEALRVEMQSCARVPKLLSEHKEGIYTLRRYSPQRSLLFDFGEPDGELSRGDVVTTYNVGNEEFHREFFISPPQWEPHEEDLQLAVFDILHMLAIRRTKLFRIGFASHVYNVLLPPVLLMSGSNGYALFPCINLYRPSKKGFRRTLSMTFIACPVEMSLDQDKRNVISSRSAALKELYRLKDDLLLPIVDPVAWKSMRKYTASGPLMHYMDLPNECAIPELLRLVSQGVLKRILSKWYGKKSDVERLVSNILFTSNMESKIATMSLLVDWNPPEGFNHAWERWLATGDDKVFCNSFFRTLFYGDYLDPYSADACRHAIQFKEFNVGNTLGADMAGMTLFNPQESLKVVLYPKSRERYPNHSIIRWMTWQVYIDSALASLRALIYKFHPILEGRGELHSIIDALDEMIQEFVDFYDLDIRDYFYRKEYEKLRTLMQVDSDYAQLLSKFASSKDDESLREQRLINKFILSLTIATVTISVVSTIAQMGGLSKFNYLMIAFALSTVLVWMGYTLFDPLRRVYKRLLRAIRSLWEIT